MGNSWIVDVDPDEGRWGTVFFACHDPPVVVIQAADVGDFVAQILAIGRGDGDETERIRGEAVDRVWLEDPFVVSKADAVNQGDAAVTAFAERVPDGLGIADLRAASPGAGFAWSRSGPEEHVVRSGSDLLFAAQPRRRGSLISRLLGRAKGRG